MGFLKNLTTKIGIEVPNAYHKIVFSSINDETGEVYARIKAYKSRAESKKPNAVALDEQFVEFQGETGKDIIDDERNLKKSVYKGIEDIPDYEVAQPVLEEGQTL